MSNPNLDELYVLMGDTPAQRRDARDDARVVDVDPTPTTNRSRPINVNAPEGDDGHTARNKLVLVGLLFGILAVGGLVTWYLWRAFGPPAQVATPDLVADTLGVTTPNPDDRAQSPGNAATEVPTMSMPNADPASTGAVTPANPEGNTESNASTPIAQATEQEANGVLVNELESVDDQVVASVLANERTAGKTTQETLTNELAQVRAELERTKQELARVQRELADARRRQTTAPVRNVRTTVTLTEVLADGAVIRDRTGQEVIVPRGTTFEVVGDRVALGVPR
jgi:hypothetical protein